MPGEAGDIPWAQHTPELVSCSVSKRSGARGVDVPASAVGNLKEGSMNLLRRFVGEEEGMETVEWAIHAALDCCRCHSRCFGHRDERLQCVHQASDGHDALTMSVVHAWSKASTVE